MKKRSDLQLFGIVGYPLAHTLSPFMQEAAFRHAGIKAFYLVLEIAPKTLKKFLSRLSHSPFLGLNVTVPYKEKLFRHLSHLTTQAKAVKAVNTLFRSQKKWIGDNTDVGGFLLALKKEGKFSIKGKKALIFGAGGGARAIVYGLCCQGIKQITICNRNAGKGAQIIKDYVRFFPKVGFARMSFKSRSAREALSESDLVVNATSLGLKKRDPSIIPSSWIPKANHRRRKLFYDLIYKPSQTKFLKMARAKGHDALNGLGMLLYQGVFAWERWAGEKAPVSVMRQALLQALRKYSE